MEDFFNHIIQGVQGYLNLVRPWKFIVTFWVLKVKEDHRILSKVTVSWNFKMVVSIPELYNQLSAYSHGLVL